MSDDLAAASIAALGALLPDHRVEAVEALGRGHIHETRVARALGPGGARRFVVQRVNATVFGDPEAVDANLRAVASHLARSLRARGVSDPGRRHLHPIADPDGRTLHRDADGHWWRAFPFIEGTRALDTLSSPSQAREAARAFGAFLADLADLPPARLRETIPSFHDLPLRIEALEDAARRDPEARRDRVGAELDAARESAAWVLAGADPGALPRRVVHNDCKLNNLLFDAASDEALCVVDLDTVMSGSALYDFGELARTAACPAPEDAGDLSRVRVDPGLLHALAEGYVEGARGLLGAEEIRALAHAAPRMALENAVRFLADHLEGDRYFRVARPGHNLARARAQLRLVDRLREAHARTSGEFDALAARARPG